MPSLRQSNPRALPSHVRRSRRIPAKPPSHISSRSKEVLSPIPRCDSTGRQLIPLAPAHGRTEEMLLRRAGGCLLAGAHFCLSHLESGQGVSAILKLRSVFGNTHIRAVRFRSQLSFSPTNRAAIMRVLIAEDDAALADFVRQGLREGSIMRWTWWKIGSRRAPRERVRLRVGDFGLGPSGARRSEWVTSFAAEVEDRGAVSGYRTMTIGRSRFRSANYRRASGRCCGAPTCRRSRCW